MPRKKVIKPHTNTPSSHTVKNKPQNKPNIPVDTPCNDPCIEAQIKAMKRANRISFGAVGVNLLIGFSTLFLVFYAVKQSDSAIETVNIANRNSREDSSQFQLINRPIMQLSNFEIVRNSINDKLIIDYMAMNLGNYPTKILSQKTRVITSYSYNNRTIINELGNTNREFLHDTTVQYYVKGIPFNETYPSGLILTKEQWKDVWDGKLNVCFWREIKYTIETQQAVTKTCIIVSVINYINSSRVIKNDEIF